MTVLSPDADNWSSPVWATVQNGVRARDFDILWSEYAATAQGETHCVVVEGPSGSGAEELVSAFAQRVAGAGAKVHRHSCRAVEATLDYAAIHHLTGLPTGPGQAPHRLSQSSFQVLAQDLEQRPMVLVLERAHWCDEPSLRWLELLLRRCRGLPLLLVISQRPALLPQWHRLLGGASPAVERRTLVLNAVEDNDVYEWQARTWSQAPDVQFARECRRVTLGLPGLLYALARELTEAGCEPGPAGVAMATRVGGRLLAEHTESVLRDHPAHVRRLAEALAVLGQPDPELLALLAPVPAALIPGALELLRSEGLLEGPGGMPPQVREAVLSNMGEAARTARYDRAARLLNDTGAEAGQIGELLLHLPAIDEPWMKDILRQAADQAERAGNVVAAVRGRARLVGSPERDVRDLISYTRALTHLDPRQAHRLVEEALRTEPDVRVRAALAVQLGKSAILLGRVPEAMTVLNAVLEELPPVERPIPAQDPSRAARVQVQATLLILACHEAPAIPGGARRAGAADRHLLEDGEAVPFDAGGAPTTRPGGPERAPRDRPPRSATVDDLAGALEGALECGWMLPGSGPGGPQQLSWWVAAAPALLRSGRGTGIAARPIVLHQHAAGSSSWRRLAAQVATLTSGAPTSAARRSRRTGILTASERQVARMAASGGSNREIATALVISLRTVEMHLTSVYRKLGISGRAGLDTTGLSTTGYPSGHPTASTTGTMTASTTGTMTASTTGAMTGSMAWRHAWPGGAEQVGA